MSFRWYGALDPVPLECIRRLAACGVRVICCNFMPVFDWTCTTLDRRMADGATILAFRSREANRIDVSQGIALPGWDASYQPQELKCLLAAYNSLGEENLWRNLTCWQFHPVAGRALRAGGRRLLGLLGSDFWNIVPKKLETVWPLDV